MGMDAFTAQDEGMNKANREKPTAYRATLKPSVGKIGNMY
jgi:hypothetical protein